jgi:multiple sugar transport system substrate-binding protein
MMPTLRGITWDHVRGIGGLRAAAGEYRGIEPTIEIGWTTRSLQSFADGSVDDLARRFDLLCIDHPSIGAAVAAGALVPLDEHLDEAFLAEQEASTVGRSFEGYRWEGHTWALATDAAAQVAVWREDLLRAAGVDVPATWPEVLEAAAALRRRGLWMAMPCIPVDAACAFLALCAAHGEEPLSKPDRVAEPGTALEALDLLGEVVRLAHPSSPELNPPRLLEAMSTSDDIAYCPLAFGYSNYARAGFRPAVLRFGSGPAGPAGRPCGTLGGAGLSVSAHGADVETAVRYAAFVAVPDVQRGAYFEGGGQPGHRGAWTDPEVNARSNGFFSDTLAGLDAGYLRPRYDGFIGFQESLGERIHRWLAEGGSPAGVLADVNAAYERSGVRVAGRA